jgi:hypothetical protein
MKTNKHKTRRDFLRKMGIGAMAMTLPSTLVTAYECNTKPVQKSDLKNLINGFDLEFIFSNDTFLGIGEVRANKTQLRNNRLPMFAQITTPDALEFVNYKVVNKSITDQAIEFEFSAQIKQGDTMEWMLHTVRNRRRMGDWTKGPVDSPETHLKLVIKPVERKLGKTTAKGFSYQYIYDSKTLPIYKITDRSSWEIGGNAKGNELWNRNGVVEPIVNFTDSKEFYSTEWYLPGYANPNVFQFHPFQTLFQGFTFTSAIEGTVITWATEVSHIRSLFEKWRGHDEIIHFHEHCNDLNSQLSTSPMEVLWIPGDLDRTGRINLYNDMREMVHQELHKQIGMKRERITTYGVIEEWTEPDFDRYTKVGLPKLLEAGCKTIFIPNECENDMNTWGLSNMCCNVDFKISKTVGEDKLKKFCQTARNAEAKVEMWCNTALSTTTERFMHSDGRGKGIAFLPQKDSIMEVIRKSESPFIRNASNAIEADHYTPRFCALNLRDKDIRAYWMKQWKYIHDEIGIEGIFLDSSFNMTSDKFHHAQFNGNKNLGGVTLDQKDLLMKYRPENEPPKLIHTMYYAHLSWVVEMQKLGYHYCGEDMGVFGINRTGPDVADRISSLCLWADSFCDFNEQAVKKAGYEPIDIFFKGLAYRMMWKIYWDIRRDKLYMGTENPLAYQLIKAFNSVTDFMYNREVLAGENGVIYTKDNTSVLWTFADFDLPLDKDCKVKNVVLNNDYSAKSIKVEKNNIYLISKS